MKQCDETVQQFQESGYFIVEDVLQASETKNLRDTIAQLPAGDEVRRKAGIYGVRNLLEISPEVRSLACDARRHFVDAILGEAAFAVRAVYFDKVPSANWSLYWHQDHAISVHDRVEVSGFVGWSNKVGVWQVQPPVEVLSRMVAIRVHLDDCTQTNGPLRVIPGSHRHGWIDDELDTWKARVPEVICLVKNGGLVVMSPLILHASAPAEVPDHRRVIHIEYAIDDLPGGLDWNNRIR